MVTPRKPGANPWTPELIDRVISLWNDGWDARRIGEEVGGMTRCQILGKIYRLRNAGLVEGHNGKGGWASRARRLAAGETLPLPKIRKRSAQKPASRMESQSERTAIRKYPRGSLTAPKTCQWLHGDPRDGNWCGAASVPGHPWCSNHYARVFLPAGVKNVA